MGKTVQTKILFVDDEPELLTSFKRTLRDSYDVETANSGIEGLKALAERGPYAVIVADMRMPGMNGIEFLVRASEEAPDSVRLMLTGDADQQTSVEAINKGQIFRFLTKPCTREA